MYKIIVTNPHAYPKVEVEDVVRLKSNHTGTLPESFVVTHVLDTYDRTGEILLERDILCNSLEDGRDYGGSAKHFYVVEEKLAKTLRGNATGVKMGIL